MSLPNDFFIFIKECINLKSLRLEKCYNRWERDAEEMFNGIRTLKKLRTLELVEIRFCKLVKQELEKLNGITHLLLIPETKDIFGYSDNLRSIVSIILSLFLLRLLIYI